jgi:hypothetical protein
MQCRRRNGRPRKARRLWRDGRWAHGRCRGWRGRDRGWHVDADGLRLTGMSLRISEQHAVAVTAGRTLRHEVNKWFDNGNFLLAPALLRRPCAGRLAPDGIARHAIGQVKDLDCHGACREVEGHVQFFVRVERRDSLFRERAGAVNHLRRRFRRTQVGSGSWPGWRLSEGSTSREWNPRRQQDSSGNCSPSNAHEFDSRSSAAASARRSAINSSAIEGFPSMNGARIRRAFSRPWRRSEEPLGLNRVVAS